jgi:adenylate cyclase class 2
MNTHAGVAEGLFMQQGYEARFFDVDLDLVRHRLGELQASCVSPRRLIRRVVLENEATRARGAGVSVRSDGSKHMLTFTRGGASAVEPGGKPSEVEVAVADFGLTQRILEELGLSVSRQQESHCEEWRFHALTFSLAEWPGLPPFLEIDGPDANAVQWATRQLGLQPAQSNVEAGPPARVIAPPQATPAGSPPPATGSREQRVAPSTAPQRQEVRSFCVAELGWSSVGSQAESGRHLVLWAVVLENTNLRHYCEQPGIQITARDKDGQVVGTGDQVLHVFPPGARIAWASSMQVKSPPHTLEVAPKPADWYPTPAQPEEFPAFGYRGVRFLVRGRNCSVTGELTNPYPTPADEVAVTALFRDGQGRLVGGETAFVRGLPAHGSVPFQLNGQAPERAGPVASLDLVSIPWPSDSGDPWDSVLGRC